MIYKVNDLFYNTPVRLKYLKNLYVELSYIVEYVNKMALSYPNIKFTFYIRYKVGQKISFKNFETLNFVWAENIALSLVVRNGTSVRHHNYHLLSLFVGI